MPFYSPVTAPSSLLFCTRRSGQSSRTVNEFGGRFAASNQVAIVGYAILDSGLRPDGFTAKIALIMGGVVLMAIGYTLLALPSDAALIGEGLARTLAQARDTEA